MDVVSACVKFIGCKDINEIQTWNQFYEFCGDKEYHSFLAQLNILLWTKHVSGVLGVCSTLKSS